MNKFLACCVNGSLKDSSLFYEFDASYGFLPTIRKGLIRSPKTERHIMEEAGLMVQLDSFHDYLNKHLAGFF